MGIHSGTRLGPYEVMAPLGAGGMGEVYRAHDTRLGRDVAVKVVMQALAKDPDRLRRFELEARTVAALNHPNILGIHDIGKYEGAPYLVSELLEGETLREKLLDGPLPVRRAVEYALGIACGLAAAHEKGIVHRDLKPENVFITRDGRVKILDFGLAKLVRPEPGSDATMTQVSHENLTQPGVVVGTVGYMSPEQVRGEPSDERSDIFSFGAVLYEMLTGKRAFKKATFAETMTAILREEPPELTETGWQGPLGLQRILSRCLEKNVERRFQSASDLAFAIEALSGTGVAQKLAEEAMKPQRAWWPWAAGAAALVLVAAGAFVWGKKAGTKPQPKFTRLTYQRGFLSDARFAKGGETVVYSAQWDDQPLQLYTVRLEFPQSTKVDLPSAMLLAVGPNGDVEIAEDPVHHTNFMSGTLAEGQISGGTPRGELDSVIASDFAPDGQTRAVVRIANHKVQLEYPVGKVIYTTSGYLDYMKVSPDGKMVAFVEHPVFDDDRGWVAIVDAEGTHKQLTGEYPTLQGLVWSRTGKEVWYTASYTTTDRVLFGVELTGKKREILATPYGMRVLDMAPDGRVLLSAQDERSEIYGIDPATKKERTGLEWFNGSGLSDIRPDGKSILYSEWGGPGGALYIVAYRKLDGSGPTALGEGSEPTFSPDGRTAAAVVLSMPPKVALHPVGTGESRRLLLGDIVQLNHVEWFPDGKHLLLEGAAEGQPLRTYGMDVEGGKPQAVGPADFQGVAVAKDGNRIVGRNGSGEAEVFDKQTQKVHLIPGSAARDYYFAKWSENGLDVLVTASTPWVGEVYRVDAETGKRSLLQRVELAEKAGSTLNLRIAYAEESKTYAYVARRITCSLYMVEGLE
jgi:eukaryotic-like serine/threonine-protein kinase